MKQLALLFTLAATLLCSCRADRPKQEITAAMAYEGVSNYCHQTYDWTVAQENPDIMSVAMGEETDSTYQVVFRSYTAAQVFFHVDKATGATRMETVVPALDIREAAGTINILDFLEDD